MSQQKLEQKHHCEEAGAATALLYSTQQQHSESQSLRSEGLTSPPPPPPPIPSLLRGYSSLVLSFDVIFEHQNENRDWMTLFFTTDPNIPDSLNIWG